MCVCVYKHGKNKLGNVFTVTKKKSINNNNKKKSFLTYLSGLLYYAVWILDKKLLLV